MKQSETKPLARCCGPLNPLQPPLANLQPMRAGFYE